MPHYLCVNCAHEWDSGGPKVVQVCAWCFCTEVTMLEEQTALECMCKPGAFEVLLDKLLDNKTKR